MNIPRARDQSKAFFRSTLPKDPRITVRPMFGNASAFVNGNMSYGLFGDDLFIRLPEKDGQEILTKGGVLLEPMKGRPMKDYVLLPKVWWKQPKTIRKWIAKIPRLDPQNAGKEKAEEIIVLLTSSELLSSSLSPGFKKPATCLKILPLQILYFRDKTKTFQSLDHILGQLVLEVPHTKS